MDMCMHMNMHMYMYTSSRRTLQSFQPKMHRSSVRLSIRPSVRPSVRPPLRRQSVRGHVHVHVHGHVHVHVTWTCTCTCACGCTFTCTCACTCTCMKKKMCIDRPSARPSVVCPFVRLSLRPSVDNPSVRPSVCPPVTPHPPFWKLLCHIHYIKTSCSLAPPDLRKSNSAKVAKDSHNSLSTKPCP
jgi:hypothetical protein